MHRITSDALDYGKHLACMKGWLSDRAKAHRQEWATVMYVHTRNIPSLKTGIVCVSAMKYILAMGLKGSYGLIIRRLDTRYRQDCIQHQPPPQSEEKDRLIA